MMDLIGGPIASGLIAMNPANHHNRRTDSAILRIVRRCPSCPGSNGPRVWGDG
jgi:hypothetical protein